jgi:site-specific DNA recombinase
LKKIRAVVYTRVSTDKEEQKTSLRFQEEHYTQFCERNGYELVKIYADEGLTGTNSKRENFLDMLYSAGLDYSFRPGEKTVNFDKSRREPLFDLIIVKDVTRFSRNMDTLRPIRLLREKGVHILFENNNLHTENDDYQERLNIYLMFAENESRDKSKKMRWSLKHKASQDKFHFSVLPYGFDYDEETKTYVINEKEAEVVREIFDLYVNHNMGVRLIADYLNEKKIPNKKGKGAWVETTLGRMIASERYIGNVVVQKYTKHDVTGTGQRIMKDEKEWKRIPNALEPIVENELWEKAQEVKKLRSQQLSNNSKKGMRLSEDIFHRKIRCGKCGSHYTRIVSNKEIDGEKVQRTSYMCYGRRKRKDCDMRGISYNVLEREINRIRTSDLNNWMDYNIKRERYATQKLMERLDSKLKDQGQQVKLIDEGIKKLDEQESNLIAVLSSGNASESVRDSIFGQIEKINDQKKELASKKLDYDAIQVEKERAVILNEMSKVETFYKKKTLSFEEVVENIKEIIIKEDRHFMVNVALPSIHSYYLWASDRKKLDMEYKRVHFFEVKY